MKRLCLVAALLSALCEARKEDVVVQLQNGELRGTHLTSRNNKTFYAFMGIPYAEPPVGELRFKVRDKVTFHSNIHFILRL